MIKSMTGFGKATKELQEKKITVEARSLNSKQMDLNLRLPYFYKDKELELRSEIVRILERGKVDVNINVDAGGETRKLGINKALVKNYYDELKSLAIDLGEEIQYLPLIMKMPDVLTNEKEEVEDKEWDILKEVLNEALLALSNFRLEEGKILLKEFTDRIQSILSLLQQVEPYDLKRFSNIREKIRKSLNELLDKDKIDENRFEQELIYYLEKLDISEEKLRLKTHCDYFLKTMQEDSTGRKLNFISQEIGREINTLGSKANDANIQKLVVQMKDELEKIKEQLLNVL